MTFKRQIPNLFTLANLLCGCIGIILVFNNYLVYAAYLIFVAAVFDFLDGFAARLLKVQSELGKQLDSMADLVTFGVLPGMMMYTLILQSFIVSEGYCGFCMIGNSFSDDIITPSLKEYSLSGIGLLIPLFSVVRLAKFNLDNRQEEGFIGLPTPSLAFFVAGITLIAIKGTDIESQVLIGDYLFPITQSTVSSLSNSGIGFYATLLFNPFILGTISVIFSILLISPLPLFALKFKSFGWAENKIRYFFLGLCLVIILAALLIKFVWIAIPIIILLYIFISIVNNIITKRK